MWHSVVQPGSQGSTYAHIWKAMALMPVNFRERDRLASGFLIHPESHPPFLQVLRPDSKADKKKRKKVSKIFHEPDLAHPAVTIVQACSGKARQNKSQGSDVSDAWSPQCIESLVMRSSATSHCDGFGQGTRQCPKIIMHLR